MKRTAELADHIGCELRGNGLATLTPSRDCKTPSPNDLSYAEEKFRNDVETSQAGCIIVRSGEWPAKTIILSDNPKLAFARAAAWLLFEPMDEVGIHPSATVAPDARIGDHVKIGAGAVVESGAVIGRNTVIEAGCYIGKRATIGNGCALHPRVVVYKDVTIGNRVIVHAGAV